MPVYFTMGVRPKAHGVLNVASCLILGSSLLCAQQPAKPAVSPKAPQQLLSQQERAEQAMQKALEQQQAAVDAFRQPAQPDSIRQQRESIARQVGAAQAVTPAQTGTASAHSATSADTSATTKTFFALPWSGSIPLAVPNVQMVDDSCEALPKNDVEKLVQDAARKQQVDPDLLRSVMRQESAFKPCAVSVAGAMGLMQIMPDTASMLGLDDPFDPAKNADAGAKFLKMMLDRYQGDIPMALGAYNAGPGRVDKAGGVPPINETMQYITGILRSLSFAY